MDHLTIYVSLFSRLGFGYRHAVLQYLEMGER